MTVTVRIAGPDDAALLHRLAAATFALACPPGTTDEAVADFVATNLSEAKFAGYLADPARDLLIVDADGVATGYTMLVAEEPYDADVAQVVTLRPTVELSKFYMLATAHGTGASAVLMQHSVDVARARGAASVWLGVNQLNARANRFYEKNGFERVGTKQFLVGGKLEDDFVRERTLQ
ncbi:GNAT family N-acetyltransferase [Conyzicola nivalis]|uniref:N-acetyltransferase n=1 Tax=Conyzicola nivalis TaxID=1477021 RepID=A0A916SLU6_9MICO|nr:GNAT family N-acetyltransferase [Conyzicola nivalis]GGB05481.1 N-acetyltransferase [Conyzicola nivalis]